MAADGERVHQQQSTTAGCSRFEPELLLEHKQPGCFFSGKKSFHVSATLKSADRPGWIFRRDEVPTAQLVVVYAVAISVPFPFLVAARAAAVVVVVVGRNTNSLHDGCGKKEAQPPARGLHRDHRSVRSEQASAWQRSVPACGWMRKITACIRWFW